MANQNLLPHHGEALLYEAVFTDTECTHILEQLQQDICWEQESIRIFGKPVLQPRLTAWYGDAGKSYRYSGLALEPRPWTPLLLFLKARVEKFAGQGFNSVLLNLYRDGSDSMGWHRDNEPELGADPVIASLSFGRTRKFRFRDYPGKKERVSCMLAPGSLLLMRGGVQQHWQHELPKTKGAEGIRINLTFRKIV